MQDESRSVHESKFVVSWTKREGGGQMLHLLLGTDWTANRDEVMKRIAADVAGRRGNRILMVPELISHETERRLCAAAGDTASRYAEVLSFTRLARRVADSMGSAAEECLDNGGRVVAMAAAAKNLSRTLEDAGTVVVPLIPWSAAGAYMASTLGVETLDYLPWAILCYTGWIFAIIWGFTGFGIAKLDDEKKKEN